MEKLSCALSHRHHLWDRSATEKRIDSFFRKPVTRASSYISSTFRPKIVTGSFLRAGDRWNFERSITHRPSNLRGPGRPIWCPGIAPTNVLGTQPAAGIASHAHDEPIYACNPGRADRGPAP